MTAGGVTGGVGVGSEEPGAIDGLAPVALLQVIEQGPLQQPARSPYLRDGAAGHLLAQGLRRPLDPARDHRLGAPEGAGDLVERGAPQLAVHHLALRGRQREHRGP